MIRGFKLHKNHLNVYLKVKMIKLSLLGFFYQGFPQKSEI